VELSELLRRRRMVRDYDPDRPVGTDQVGAVLAAMLRAPSAGFSQGVSLLVLTEAGDRDAFWAATADRESRWLTRMRQAPVLILVWTSRDAYLDRYAKPDKGWTDRNPGRWSAPYWFVDAGMASMAGLLAAVDGGLGACFFGVPADRLDAVREAFAVPADQLSVGAVSLGHAAPGSPGSAGRRPRRPPEDLIHRGRWNSGNL
jgi:nitroreductase